MVVAHSHTLQGSGELHRITNAAVEERPAQQKGLPSVSMQHGI